MNITRATTLLLLIINALFISQSWGQTNGFCNLVWSDEFDVPGVDTTKWQIEQSCSGMGNMELECYTARSKNVFVNNGDLVLAAFAETYTGTQAGCTDTSGCTNTQQYTSGRVNSAINPAGSFLRGRMEARAKLTSGSHLWPAFWMLPTAYAYGGWAASGEIDIMEQRGDIPSNISGTLHHGAQWPNNIYTTTGDHDFGADLSQDYHVYAVEWTETSLSWYVDDNNFQTYNLTRWWNSTAANPYTAMGQPWDQKFHFVLNLAVGGGFFNNYPPLTPAQAAAWKVSEFRIDYVRAYSYGGDCPATASSNWLLKYSPIIWPVIGGVVLLVGIAVLAVGIYLRKKRQFDIAESWSAGQGTQMVTIFPGSP